MRTWIYSRLACTRNITIINSGPFYSRIILIICTGTKYRTLNIKFVAQGTCHDRAARDSEFDFYDPDGSFNFFFAERRDRYTFNCLSEQHVIILKLSNRVSEAGNCPAGKWRAFLRVNSMLQLYKLLGQVSFNVRANVALRCFCYITRFRTGVLDIRETKYKTSNIVDIKKHGTSIN